MTAKPRVYLAGPLGFSEAGRHFHHAVLMPFIRALGYHVLDPWSLTPPGNIEAVQAMPDGPERRAAWRTLNAEIARTNLMALDEAQAVVAILDGADVDSGTAAEIGYAFARGIPIVGYRSDVRLAGDNDGAVVNLQVEYFVRASGGGLVTSLRDVQRVLRVLAAGRVSATARRGRLRKRLRAPASRPDFDAARRRAPHC
jgi:nucleoside 2-deoxyribosyltransferase